MKAIRGYRFLAVVVALLTGGYASLGLAESTPAGAVDKAQPASDTPKATADKGKPIEQPNPTDNTKKPVDVSGKWYASPDGRFVLIDIDREASGEIERLPQNRIWEASGFVYVLDRKTMTTVELPSYDRGADFAWSPDSKHLVYNDFAGSSETYCYVYEFAVKSGKLVARKTDLQKQLQRVSDVAPLFTAVHQYVEGKKWIDARTLSLDISAQPTDDYKWHEWKYSYTVDGHFKKLKHEEGRCGGDGK